MDGAMWLPEFDQEMANTRKMLEAIPDEHLDYRPHDRSWTLRELASHLSNIPSWTGITLTTTELDIDQDWSREEPANREEILAEFDGHVAEARPVLEATGAEDMMVPWTLKTGDEVHFTLPRAAVFRSFVMSHMIHHRAQLGVYLRMLGVPVPGMYGPSADEMK